MKLDKAVPPDELVWHRVRCAFRCDDTKVETLEGVESISNILRLPVLRVLGQQSYLAGSRAAVRVIVSDSKGDVIPGRGAVRIALEADGKEQRTLFTGRLNHRGTTEAQFQFPEGVTGNCNLHYTVDTSLGATEYTQTIRLQDKVGILLTTDKTIYQPGQMIHVRALALNRTDHRAAGKRNLLLEVEDSHGNKVFKKATSTDEFGIGSADFGLASEVNLGTYHVRGNPGRGRHGLSQHRGDCVGRGEIRAAEIQGRAEFRVTRREEEARVPAWGSRERHGASKLFLWKSVGWRRRFRESRRNGCHDLHGRFG